MIQFKSNIDTIFDVLIKMEIKADVFLSNMACLNKAENNNGFVVKVFIDSDAQYLSLINHKYRAKDSKKRDPSGINQEFLC